MTSIGKGIPQWQPWAAIGGFALLLHFPWEMLQVTLYRGMPEAGHWSAVLRCTQATAGDVVIAGMAYFIGSWSANDRLWLGPLQRRPVALYLASGLAITAGLEWLNVHIWKEWAYGPAMPVIAGIGLAPTLQWIVIPILALWLARRHLGWSPYVVVPHRSASGPTGRA